MKEKLIKLLNNSYSPYSKFSVAAIVVMKDKQEFIGVNIENASYGATCCAERNAIFAAISNGYSRYDFDKLYVMCDCDDIGTPCFMCRQVISEMFETNREVICMNPKGKEKVYKVSDLCPNPFTDDTLNS